MNDTRYGMKGGNGSRGKGGRTFDIAVFEDDRAFAGQLESFINRYTHKPTAINTDEPMEIEEYARQADHPVLYFLDIVMQNKTPGFDLARQISQQNPASLIVFITHYPHKILGNPFYKVLSFSFISKNSNAVEREIRDTITLAEKALKNECLLIYSNKFETLYIPHDAIVYIESVKGTNSVCIHCTEGQYIIRETLDKLFLRLNGTDFIRCHRSVIANKKNIRRLDKKTQTISFRGGASCPYSPWRMGGGQET